MNLPDRFPELCAAVYKLLNDDDLVNQARDIATDITDPMPNSISAEVYDTTYRLLDKNANYLINQALLVVLRERI